MIGQKIQLRLLSWVFLGTSVLLSGCSGIEVVTSGTAAAGIAVAQERSIGRAVDDAAIQIQIRHYLLQASDDLFIRVGSEVHEGRVLLTGVVQTADDRVEAVRLAWQVEGIFEVINEIQISDRSSIVDYLTDTKITSQLRFQMLRDRDIADINYSVETVNGIVYLMGISRNKAELEKLTTHASNIAGVQKVVSHVRVSDNVE